MPTAEAGSLLKGAAVVDKAWGDSSIGEARADEPAAIDVTDGEGTPEDELVHAASTSAAAAMTTTGRTVVSS
ncbi:MAG: hypothetical protein M3Y77_20500 [Actinomycetota bacterium]|nr:hypothetical protein [Actinomycetota bacterium]